MLAKIAIAVAVYIALSPHILTLKFRMVVISLTVGVTSGLIGTAARLEPVEMIPVNLGYGIVAGVVVTALLHFASEGAMNFGAARRHRPNR